MIKVLILGLVVSYYMPPIEHEVFVYGDAPYAMLVSKPDSLEVPVSFSQLLTHARPRDTSGFATLSYLPTSANGSDAHIFGVCQQRSLGIGLCSTLLTSQCTTDVTRYRDSKIVVQCSLGSGFGRSLLFFAFALERSEKTHNGKCVKVYLTYHYYVISAL
jgi:hypothetical protein